MAARGVCRRRCGATTRRSPETGGRSRPRRDGWFAKEHGGETTKLSGSSRDGCPRGRRVRTTAFGIPYTLRPLERGTVNIPNWPDDDSPRETCAPCPSCHLEHSTVMVTSSSWHYCQCLACGRLWREENGRRPGHRVSQISCVTGKLRLATALTLAIAVPVPPPARRRDSTRWQEVIVPPGMTVSFTPRVEPIRRRAQLQSTRRLNMSGRHRICRSRHRARIVRPSGLRVSRCASGSATAPSIPTRAGSPRRSAGSWS